MPKVKSNRSAAKRVRVRGSGGLKRSKAYASHLLSSKSRKRKRRLRKTVTLAPGDARRMKRLLGKA